MPAAAGIIGGLVSAGGSIIGGIQQEKGLSRAQRTQVELQNRQLAFAREQLERFDPFLDSAQGLIRNLQSQVARPSAQDPLFKEALRNARSALSATGNLRSGFAQDTIGRLALDAEDRRFNRGLALSQAAGQIGTQGNQLGASLFTSGLNISNNIAQLQAARGANTAGIFGGALGNIAGGIQDFGQQLQTQRLLDSLSTFRS